MRIEALVGSVDDRLGKSCVDEVFAIRVSKVRLYILLISHYNRERLLGRKGSRWDTGKPGLDKLGYIKKFLKDFYIYIIFIYSLSIYSSYLKSFP